MAVVYMNNVQGRRHAVLFGPSAFYDLEASSRFQNGQLQRVERLLSKGRECIVAAHGSDGLVVFKSYAFDRLATVQEGGRDLQVFFGKPRGTAITMALDDAWDHPLYAPFFNSARHFRQESIWAWGRNGRHGAPATKRIPQVRGRRR